MRTLLVLLLTCQLGIGCEADGLIWMPPTNHADPLFRFVRNGRAGFIDDKGRVVIQPTLQVRGNWSQYFEEGMLSLGASSGPFINATGKQVIGRELDRVWDFSDGVAPAMESSSKSSPWGYVDRAGKWAISPRFPSYPNGLVSGFSEGLAAVETNGKLGYIDHSGQFAIPQQFVAGTSFEEGVARVAVSGPCSYGHYGSIDPCSAMEQSTAPATGAQRVTGGELKPCQWSFIDKKGNKVFNATFEATMGFHEGLAAVRVADKWGFIDHQGKFVITPRFSAVHSFSDGRALVSTGATSGFIDRTGAMRFQVTYYKSEPFSEGVTVVGHPDDGYVFVDQEGRQTIRERFQIASRFFHGLAHVKLSGPTYGGGTFAYIDKTGKRVFTYTR